MYFNESYPCNNMLLLPPYPRKVSCVEVQGAESCQNENTGQPEDNLQFLKLGLWLRFLGKNVEMCGIPDLVCLMA